MRRLVFEAKKGLQIKFEGLYQPTLIN